MKTIRNVALMLALAAGATSLAQAQTPAQAQPAASYHGQSLTRAEVRADPCGSAPAWSASGAARPRPISTAVNTGSPMPSMCACAAEYRPKCSARAGGPIGGAAGVACAMLDAPPQSSYSLHLADLELDLLRGRVIRNREVLRLTPKEFALLAFLMQRPGEVYDAWQLAEQVWGMQLPVFERKNPKSHAVAIAVRRLRRKIDAGRSPACCTRCAAGPICWPLWIESASLDRPLWRFVELRGDAHDAVRRARTFPSQSHGVSHHASPAQYAHPAGAAPLGVWHASAGRCHRSQRSAAGLAIPERKALGLAIRT